MTPAPSPVSCEKLFEPIRINSMTVKNRIVMTAMHLNYTGTGEVTPQLTDFYRARVAGGAGLIVVGGCTVDREGGGSVMIGAWDDKFIPGLSAFIEEMKKADPSVMVAMQLYHAGRYAMSWLTGVQPVSASALNSRFNRETPRALSIEEIPEFERHFADAALRAKKCGFDAIEIIASAGYLICQFLSPTTNKREDEYGGPLENRVRFGVETVQKVRSVVGKDYPVMIRVAGADFVPGGNTNIEAREICRHYEKAGVDAISVTGGWHETQVPQLTMSVPRGAYVYLAHGIKKAVNVPVTACNRINDPLLAEEILCQGKADMVGIARGLIADPELPNKARAGKFRLIRKCIACNQGCLDHVFLGLDVNCLVNFHVGREGLYPSVEKVCPSARVVVIGGGPGGCEAARVAALRGHNVTLIEEDAEIGGGLRLCAAPRGREEFGQVIEYYKAALEDLGVDIRTGVKATLELVRSLAPDVVIAATGTTPLLPRIVKESRMQNVFTAKDVLLGKAVCYGDTVVVGGGAVGCETALMLAHQGMMSPENAAFLIETRAESSERVADLLLQPARRVVIVEMLPKIGEGIGKSTRWTIKLDLARSHVQVLKETKVLAIEEQGVLVERSGGSQELIPCKNVVIAVGLASERHLAEQLQAEGMDVRIIGDALKPRRAIEAIEEGFRAGWNIRVGHD